MAQKLSKKAKAAKRKRDLATANTRKREKMRAENQRKRRKAIKKGKNIKGKDYDHTKKRFVSVKANRGGHGRGTKKKK
tara:strand:- start:372 stop:605 length:234 start_codon:yes stop_codon:yes gene_type:complete